MPEEKLINRPEYLEKLIKWSADTTLIKIITGVRRCGKSKLLDLFKSHLLANGTSESQIHKIDLDLLENKWLHEPTALYNHILNVVQPDKLNYVFLDEVQLVRRHVLVRDYAYVFIPQSLVYVVYAFFILFLVFGIQFRNLFDSGFGYLRFFCPLLSVPFGYPGL